MEALASTIESYIRKLSLIENQYLSVGKRNQRYWLMGQTIIFFFGIITPFIVSFRKSEFFPAQFWVYWCMITPPLVVAVNWFVNYYDVKDKFKMAIKRAGNYNFLIEQSRGKLMAIHTTEQASTLYNEIVEEARKIELS